LGEVKRALGFSIVILVLRDVVKTLGSFKQLGFLGGLALVLSILILLGCGLS